MASSGRRLVSPFESVLDELREHSLEARRTSAQDRPAPDARRERPARPRPELHIETGVVSAPRASRARTSLFLPVSLALHVAALLSLVLLPLLMLDALPAVTSTARAFFVEPVLAPPPPPPPPPPSAAAARPQPKPVVPETAALVAPVQAPEQIKPEEGIDLGVSGGVPGGVEGGVPGGVVGGVVGGLPDAPSPVQPLRVGGQIKEPKRVKHVDPVYPELAKRARVQGFVILECRIDASGRVTDARVLRGIPLLNEAAIAAVKQWVYMPTLLDGQPFPVLMTITVAFALE